jgi:hypothetical protein
MSPGFQPAQLDIPKPGFASASTPATEKASRPIHVNAFFIIKFFKKDKCTTN